MVGEGDGERVGRVEEERQREQQGSRTPLCRRSTLQCRLFEGVFYGETGEMRSNRDGYR